MIPRTSESLFAPVGFAVLARMKYRAMANHVRQVTSEAPIKVLVTSLFVGVIWFALYLLFAGVFDYFKTNVLQSVIAIPLIFNFFFVAVLILLTFSNAIIVYGSMFTAPEAHYLLSAPLRPTTTVSVNYLESLVFSSWSLFLLGLPLMMAMASTQGGTWVFYPLFVAFFLAFVPIPGSLGLLLAWVVARFLPRSVRRMLVYAGVTIIVLTIIWGLRSVRGVQALAEDWVNSFFARLSIVEASILPSTWVTRGIEAALRDRHDLAMRYLCVVIANAVFLSWLAVYVVSRGFVPAHNKAGATHGRVGRQAVKASGGVAGRLFGFLPLHARLIAAKDLRTFLRDPMQWSQLAILFGLMALYLANTPRFDIDDSGTRWYIIVPFLNLTAVSFILATFTSRFVFPMVSLEGRQLWLIGLFPVHRAWILIAKFAFAFVVTFSIAAGVTVLASYILRISLTATLLNLGVTASICYGLCGFAVGIGARMPLFHQTNPARIANGFGGTVNLIASVMLITIMLGQMAYVTYRVGRDGAPHGAQPALYTIFASAILTGLIAGTVALIIGARHFGRIET